MTAAAPVVRRESDAGVRELAARAPAPDLRGDVLVVEDYREQLAARARERHLPSLFVPLVLNFGPAYRLLDPQDESVAAEHRSFTGGLGEAVSVTESPGTARCVQVNLTPLGARRVLGVPLRELRDRVVGLHELLGRAAGELEERLAEAPGGEARLPLAERFLRARLAAAEPARPDVAYAWRRLLDTGGRLRVEALAAELGCSRRHLASQFHDGVGLGPKAAARLVRFTRAAALLASGVGGAETAHRCGYADQAHLVHEVRRLSGRTPAALARAPEVRFLQDAASRGS